MSASWKALNATFAPTESRPFPSALVVLVTLLVVAGFTVPSLPGAVGARHAPMAPLAHVSPAATLPTSAASMIRSTTPTAPTLSGAPFPLHLGNYQFPGPHPTSFGSLGVPPGGEALNTVLSQASPASTSTPNWDNRFCHGLWPDGTSPSDSQSYYAPGCYGHDEPGIEFYSSLPGSGGNTTWNVTLPTDRSSTQNQSDVYSAIWFGMTLNDQLGWMHQCFLELQFYPDQTWINGYGPGFTNQVATVNGAWIGAAVAWEINAATGQEVPCFYQPMYNGSATFGASYFNMTQGDQISVTTTGWVGSPYGVNLTVNDWTQHQVSMMTLWDPFGNYPLNPSYTTNTFENGLQWTPGGEYPVAFSFENGHAGNYNWPSSNLYGGCSPGKPPATAAYPDVPCPSYDGASWANDTLSPWQISVPTFFNAQSIDHPSQVAFTQDFGGVGTLSDIGQGSCNGQIGSAWCTYPWYSYSCLTHAFNFGATDFPGVTSDFGQLYQYSQTLEYNGLGFGYFPPTNYSIPACGAATSAVSVTTSGAPGGSVYFLSTDTNNQTFPGLLAGNYSIYPYAPPGGSFSHWVTTGGVSILGSSTDLWATLLVDGTGSVTADFTLAPTMTTVTFSDLGTTVPGTIVLSPERTFTNGIPIGTFANGSSMSLAPGIYGVQGMPSPGANFSLWTTTGAGVSIEPTGFPYSWLDVNGAGGSATLTANYLPSPDNASMIIQVIGVGNASFNGVMTNTTNTTNVSVGTYPVLALPDPGWTFAGWSYGGSAEMTDFNASSNVTVENGTSIVLAFFSPNATVENVTLVDSPASGGMIGLGSPFPVPSGVTVPTSPGTTQLIAFPSGGYVLTGWAVNDSAAAWINGSDSNPMVTINDSVTITATFAPAPVTNLSFFVTPSSAGFITFNAGFYTDGTYNASVSFGRAYLLNAYPFAGWQFTGFTATNGASNLTGPDAFGYWETPVNATGSITAHFAPVLIAISFASNALTGVSLTINGSTIGVGDTAWLPFGTYAISLNYAASIEEFQGWASTPGLLLGDPNASSTNVSFSPFSSGTLMAIIDGPLTVATFAATPSAIDLGGSTTISAVPYGGVAPYGFSFSSLPPGCAASGSSFLCTPTTVGSTSVGVTISDTFGLSAQATATVVVNALPSVSAFTVSPSEIDVGQSTAITTTLAGGTGPFAYAYSALPTGCTSVSAATLTCSPTAPGTTSVGVTATDVYGHAASSAVTLTVQPAPAVSTLTASRVLLDVGMTTTLTATASGTGTLSYAWTGLPTGCTTSDSATISCVPHAAGTATVVVTATDSLGGTATKSVDLTVAALPSAVVSTSPTTIDQGATAWINVTGQGGTGGLSYSFAGLPSGCASSNTTSLSCVPTASGTFTVTVTVTDALHQSANATTTLTVNAPSTGTTGLGGLSWAEVGGIIVVILLVVAVLAFLMMRRRPAKPAETPPP